jgi:hypothetical protein
MAATVKGKGEKVKGSGEKGERRKEKGQGRKLGRLAGFPFLLSPFLLSPFPAGLCYAAP